MYFKVLQTHFWRKWAVSRRRHNYAVLPKKIKEIHPWLVPKTQYGMSSLPWVVR